MSAYRICYNFCDSAFRALHLLVNQEPQEMQIAFAKHWLGKQSVALLLLVMLETSKWDPGPSQTEVSLILFSEGGGWLAKFTLDWEYWPGPVKHVTRLLFPAFPVVCLRPALLFSTGVRVHVKEDRAWWKCVRELTLEAHKGDDCNRQNLQSKQLNNLLIPIAAHLTMYHISKSLKIPKGPL